VCCAVELIVGGTLCAEVWVVVECGRGIVGNGGSGGVSEAGMGGERSTGEEVCAGGEFCVR
jgi:hypothetical protein